MRVQQLAARRAQGWRLGRFSLFLIFTRPARPPPLGPRRHWPPARGAPPRDQRAGRDRRGQELGRGLAVRLPGPLSVPAGAGRGLPAGRARCGHAAQVSGRRTGRAIVICSRTPSIVASKGSDSHRVAAQGLIPREASKPVFSPCCGTYGPLGFGSRYYLRLGNCVEDYSCAFI